MACLHHAVHGSWCCYNSMFAQDRSTNFISDCLAVKYIPSQEFSKNFIFSLTKHCHKLLWKNSYSSYDYTDAMYEKLMTNEGY